MEARGKLRIGFVSTRFAGTDGVSLESAKWAEVLWRDRHVSFWYGGLLDRDPEASLCIPEAHFAHPEVEWINAQVWGRETRSPLVSRRIRALAAYLKASLYEFARRYKLDFLVPQNVLAIPMHIPLGIALTEFLAESGLPSIAHHHDFFWERTRFSVNAVPDYLDTAFPPRLPRMAHVVINRLAQEQLALRKGLSSLLIPNVFNFAKPAPLPDDYSSDFRSEIGIADDDILILQPTRVVARKGIENAIKLVAMLKNPKCKLVVTHEAGDEGLEYRNMLQDLADNEEVDLRFVSDRISEYRQRDALGRKLYTLWDAYPHADLVTFPSIYEGFGNALLEAIYFRRPIVVGRYAIFVSDIEPKGFRLPVIDGFVGGRVAQEVERLLSDTAYRQEVINWNYEIASRFFSYEVLRSSLRVLLGVSE